ncbi:LemA family protein [Roseivirga sp. BDSF3-8]|uniref:LemA family protein n=1 Tax=Roseivirga sp. BDSF3-8 TaxID=3241598 RepID=UPI003531F418
MNLISLIAIIVAVVLLLFIFMYNTLIKKRNAVDNATGGVDAQLKKRYDLIPNLVSTVQQYTTHERELIERVTALRAETKWSTMNMQEKMQLDEEISGRMHNLMAVAEGYPDLRAQENYQLLQRSLNEVEAQISASRRAYNATVTEYNDGIQVFPQNMVAGWMGLKPKQVFTATQAERQNVNVQELFNNKK